MIARLHQKCFLLLERSLIGRYCIGRYYCACTYNEGILALLLFMHGIDLKLGRKYARNSDGNHVRAAEKN